MSLEMVEGILTLKLGLVESTALAVLLLLCGQYLRRRVWALERFCIPAPVIGGIAFSILALILKQANMMDFSFDTTVQSPFMLVFLPRLA